MGWFPESWLPCSHSSVSEFKSASEDGASPLRALFARLSSLRWKRRPREAGMEPVKRFDARYKSVKFFKSPMLSTMLPVSLLEERFKKRSEERLPISEGICPCRSLSARSRKMSSDSAKSSRGKWLFRFCRFQITHTILLCPLLISPTSTPCHLETSCSLPFHKACTAPPIAFHDLSRFSLSCSSVEGEVGGVVFARLEGT
mmetsp:Transcript_25649/g.53299  ORF Transcript_25649/g.53299 Transcript_25649/m.53299 type:complete len:201 (-) Transcript_25649:831-1433(-)